MLILQEFLTRYTYAGILAALLLGSMGVPIPEEMPIVAAGILSHEGLARWWLALPMCLLGVLSGDVVLYWTGRRWGERILRWRMVRWVLTAPRAEALKEAYRQHALKTVVTARHVAGLRAAAFLTAGMARVPFWKFILADVHRVERWAALAVLIVLAGGVVVSGVRWNRRVPKGPERL